MVLVSVTIRIAIPVQDSIRRHLTACPVYIGPDEIGLDEEKEKINEGVHHSETCDSFSSLCTRFNVGTLSICINESRRGGKHMAWQCQCNCKFSLDLVLVLRYRHGMMVRYAIELLLEFR